MKYKLYSLYSFFNSDIIQWARVLSFLILGIAAYLFRENGDIVLRIIPLYFILIVQELFIFWKLNISRPIKKISDNKNNLIESVDFRTRMLLQRHGVVGGLKKIKNTDEVKNLTQFLHADFPIEDIVSLDELLHQASEIVAYSYGKYIHAIDIYVSYLLLAEVKGKMLFEKEIDKEDVMLLDTWIRKEYGYDNAIHHEAHFSGNGVYDSLVYGWSAELSRYALNFTQEVLREDSTKPIGRDKEYDLLITSLSKSSARNVLLVGSPGVGKTSLVRQLALDSNAGKLPSHLSHKVVFKLYAERLLAGAENKGDLEARFVALFEELFHAGNIIVYIPSIENIFGGGGIDLDLSGILSEYLKSNRLIVVGTTTESSYQTYIYPKQELRDLIDIVQISEPDAKLLLFMLLEKSRELIHAHGVQITYNGLKETIELSSSYISDGTSLPGRAVRLLEDVITHSKTHGIKIIDKNEVRGFVEQKVHIVLSKPNAQESNQLLHLEQGMHKRIVSQDEAIKDIADAMRRVRSGMKDENRPIASFLFLGPTGVGKTETAKALASLYFGNDNSMIRLDMSEYQTQDSLERLLGSNNPNEFIDNLGNKVLNNPFTLLLLDEFEKAHPKILDIFLQILDEGKLTDNTGRIISFANAIIIATSNAGSELIREKIGNKTVTVDEKQLLVDQILRSNIFKPELVNRFDDVVVFKALNELDIVLIADNFMKEIEEKLSEQHITLSYGKDVLEFIANASYSEEFGARNVRRFIEQAVENHISTKLLDNTLIPGGRAVISIVNNSIVVNSA